MASNPCDVCVNYSYDEEFEEYTCMVDLDEDDMERFVRGSFQNCPFFKFGDEYLIARKQ